ncbi:MAG: 1,6-anhydro-N-acetylmuramyl-L-alanine amidase AmpD, partial [Comamonadaceae bacterium]
MSPEGGAQPTAADPEWDAGWWRPARRLDSPNFGLRPAGAQIDLI